MMNLSDFNVDVTGLSDSTTQVQNAVDGCGGLLEWNGGSTVRIDGEINITSPLRIIGPGIDQWRNGGASANIITTGTTNDIFRINADNVYIDGLNFVGTASRFVNNGPSAIVVGDTGSATITGLTLRNVSASSHGSAVRFERASNFVIDRCDLQSYNTTVVQNFVDTDKGDSLITNSDFAADSTSGKCIIQKSSGGLRIQNNKFLTCQDSIYIPWTNGLSGGPIIQGNSFENMSRRGIFIVGDGESVINGLTIQNNWINGAIDSVFIDNSAVVKRALISGNNILGGPTSIGINVGSATSEFLIADNLMDGNGASPSYGVFVRDGASGHVGPNRMTGFTTNVINQSSATTVSAQW